MTSEDRERARARAEIRALDTALVCLTLTVAVLIAHWWGWIP